MYGVEKNAKDNADRTRATLKAGGASDKTAARVANRQESRETRNGNKWVRNNVGLD